MRPDGHYLAGPTGTAQISIPVRELGCLHWAIGNEKVLAWFKSETGSQYLPPRSAIERMIDEATGADTAFILKFAAWMTENIWGAE
jgi:hypothetical protein